jgi:hypothetical protein
MKEAKGLKCYVIMPFKPVYERFYFDVIEPAVTVCGFVADKANETPTFDMLTNMIIPDMLNAEVIIAVLIIPGGDSELNPTVQYELGIAQSFRKPTVLITTTKSLDKNLYLKGQGALIYDEETPLKFQCPEDTKSVQGQIRGAIRAIQAAGTGYIPNTAITNALKAPEVRRVFVDDLKKDWLWGYIDTYERKLRTTKETWVMTSDLHWYAKDVPYECLLKRAIKAGQKYRILYTNNNPDAQEDIEKIKSAVENFVGETEAQQRLKCIHTEYKAFLNFTIYDPDNNAKQDAIFLEPMAYVMGKDAYDKHLIKSSSEVDPICESCIDESHFPALKTKLKDDCDFSKKLSQLPSTEKWKESTFDIKVYPDNVDKLKDIFWTEWIKAIDKALQAGKMNKGEAEYWRIK